jgi:HK97 gp10 family phage protein
MAGFKLTDRSTDLLRAIENKALQKLTLAALVVVSSAKDLVPVRTGTLKRSINYKVNSQAKSAHIGSNIFYAKYVELGTSKWEGKPFLRPALFNNWDTIQRIFAQK